MSQKIIIHKGGTGSGHHGHEGRPGILGGSTPGKGGSGYKVGDPQYLAMRAVRRKDRDLRKLIAAKASKEEISKAKAAYEKAQGRYIDLHGERWVNPKFGKEPQTSRYEFGRGTVPVGVMSSSPYSLTSPGSDILDRGLEKIGAASWSTADTDKRGVVKDTIVNNLNDQTQLGYSEINKGIAQWADTSNDNDMRSLSLQEAAAEEFEVPFSEWQQKRLERIKDDARIGLENTIQTADTYYKYTPSHGPVNNWSRDQERTFLRGMYEHTQDSFKKLGYSPDDTVVLYRGYKLLPGQTTNLNEHMSYSMNAMESWSVSPKVAGYNYFGGGGGIVVAMEVPLKNILSTARTGFGCLEEGEFVVLGTEGAEVIVID